jgi:hypothetical protein
MATVLIIGHCGFDGSRIEQIAKNIGAKTILLASIAETHQHLESDKPADLLLINRIFSDTAEEGLRLIEELKESGKQMMLVSNYEDAQQKAVTLGALQGFGKAMSDEEIEERIAPALQ